MGNRRIMRARGFHRAWLIAERLRRLEDGAGVILREALLHQCLSKQRRWAWWNNSSSSSGRGVVAL